MKILLTCPNCGNKRLQHYRGSTQRFATVWKGDSKMQKYKINVSVDEAFEWIGDFQIVIVIPEHGLDMMLEAYIENYLKSILDEGVYLHMTWDYSNEEDVKK